MKNAIIILSLFMLLPNCKSHKVTQKEVVENTTSIKKDSSIDYKSSRLDSVFDYSNTRNVDYFESVTTIENPIFKTNDTKTISLAGLWTVNKTAFGAEAVNNDDTTKKALFDSTKAQLTLIDRGKKKIIKNAIEFSASKITNSTKKYNYHSDSSYKAALKKADDELKAKAALDSTNLAKTEKENVNKGTNVNGFGAIVPWFIGIALVLAVVIIVYRKTKK